MNFLKRALLSVKRKPTKTLLLFFIIFVLGNVIAGAISIQKAADNVEKNIKARMGAVTTIRIDYEEIQKMFEENPDAEYPDIKNIQPDLVESIGASTYVKYYDYSITSNIGSETLKAYMPKPVDGIEERGDDLLSGVYMYTLQGVQYHKVASIEEGKNKLVDGTVFTPEQISKGEAVGIINKKLADENNIRVGDTVVLTHYLIDYEKLNESRGADSSIQDFTKETRDLPLKIIGIFDEVPKEESSSSREDKWMKHYNEKRIGNTIIVPNAIVKSELQYEMAQYMEGTPSDDDMIFIQPLFYLNNPEDIEDFKEESTPLLPPYYIMATSVDNYNQIAAPVKETSKMANYILIVAIAATVLIISLVVLLFLRDRKHELGIYLSLGEAKTKVIGQILIEVLLIAILGITLSVFTGNMLARGLSDSMIQSQIEKQDEGEGGRFIGFDEGLQNDLTTEDVISAYEINLSAGYIVLFYGVGLLTIIVSTVVPMIYIVRLNPKKIMM